MIQQFFSRYRLRYIRALIYMLQSSEYQTRDYISWFHRIKDFTNVEKRKSLVFTTKALIFLLIGYLAYLLSYAVLVYLVLYSGSPSVVNHGIALVWILVFPWIIAYGILVPLVLFNFLLQRPIEYLALRKARDILARHRGVKIAIAGSYGKTTMREILRSILAQGKRVAAPGKSYNTPIGISRFIEKLTGDEEILIFELGEYYPGDIDRLCVIIQPDIGVITGVNEAHLEKFKTLNKTRETIFELSKYVAPSKLYINGDDLNTCFNISAGNILYSKNKVGEWIVSKQNSDLEGTSFRMEIAGSSHDFHSVLLGLHQIGPLGAAAHMAIQCGLTVEQARRGVAQTSSFDSRLEKKELGGVILLDDSYNGNPAGVRAAISFLASLRGHRRWYVTPGLVEMGEKTKQVHMEIGRDLGRSGIENIVLIRTSVAPFIESGILQAKKGDIAITRFDTMPAFLKALPLLTLEGDVVLIQNDWPDQYI